MIDRKEMLEKFMQNDLLLSLSELKSNKLADVSFLKDSGDPLIEALKKLIYSYCQNDAQITVLRNVNMEIDKNSMRNRK